MTTTSEMNAYTKQQILDMNLPAHNTDEWLVDEDGIDWGNWRFYPGEAGQYGEFTDGHDYAGIDCAPDDGWILSQERTE